MTSIIVKQTTIPILGAATASTFPVARIFCVGRNYREHAIEMGSDPDREPPFFFMKPADAAVNAGVIDAARDGHLVVPYPPQTANLHFEGELVVAIGKGGSNIAVKDADSHVFGYAVGCDLTRRDLQADAKKKGRPWDAGKAFEFSAPCSPIVAKGGDSGGIQISGSSILSLKVNGVRQQETTLDKMIWNVPQTISYLSTLFRLKPGDLLMTGTPSGVGGLEIGDNVKVSCGDLPLCEFSIGPPDV